MKRTAQVTPREALDRDSFGLMLDFLVGDHAYWTKVYNEVMRQLDKCCTGTCSDCDNPIGLPVGTPGYCEWCTPDDEDFLVAPVVTERGDYGRHDVGVWRDEMLLPYFAREEPGQIFI